MQFNRNSLFARSDTIFGVCQSLGQDLGVSPNWFRVAFAVAVIFNLEIALAAYAGLGLIVLVSHLAYPGRKAAAEQAAPVEAQAGEAVAAGHVAEAALAEAA